LQNSTKDGSSLFVLIFIFVDNRREEKRFRNPTVPGIP